MPLFNLVNLGKRVLLLSSGEPWLADSPDPSEVLSPYTRDRLLTTVNKHPTAYVCVETLRSLPSTLYPIVL